MSGQTGNRVLLLMAGCALATHALAAVRASLDASRVAAGDTVQLTLEHDGVTSGQPDVTPLQHDFDILGTSSSTSVQILNGSASERTEVDLTLAPKVTGHLTIPSLSWGGERSQPLSLVVSGPGGAAQPGVAGAPSGLKVFIESSTSPAHPYLQAAVHLTVRLFTSEVLYHADLELPENGNVLMKQVGPDENGSVERNGRNYQVITRRYLLFPLHSGKITLQGPVLDAEVAVRQRSPFPNNPFGSFFGGQLFGGVLRTARPVRLHGDPIVLSVRPRPATAVGSYWLPARDVTLSGDWNPAKLTARAGDPVTLDLNLRATGLTAAQLPDLSSLLSIPSGLKAYPDQPRLSDSARDGNVVGSRDQTIALMADSPGHYTIPALTVTWWDTQTSQSRLATLPARTLTILPAAGAAATASAPPAPAASSAQVTVPAGSASSASVNKSANGAAPPATAAQRHTPARSPSEWEWISIGLAVVWLSTLGAWFWSRRSRAKRRPGGSGNGPAPRQFPLDASRERSAFRSACEANDAHAARSHLLAWTTALWGTAPAGINAIAARIGDPTVAALLRDLDRACYAGGAWQGHPLAAALRELPSLGKRMRDRDGLAPLYP